MQIEIWVLNKLHNNMPVSTMIHLENTYSNKHNLKIGMKQYI